MTGTWVFCSRERGRGAFSRVAGSSFHVGSLAPQGSGCRVSAEFVFSGH